MIQRPSRRGYVMLVALVLFGALAAIGAATMQVTSMDERVAYHHARHLVARHSAKAAVKYGVVHLTFSKPTESGWDDLENRPGYELMGAGYEHGPTVASDNDWHDDQAQYPVADFEVFLRYERCSAAPPGYSAEMGSPNSFRSDYWRVTAQSSVSSTSGYYSSSSEARTVARKAAKGDCKIR